MPRVGGALSARSRQYHGTAASPSTAARAPARHRARRPTAVASAADCCVGARPAGCRAPRRTVKFEGFRSGRSSLLGGRSTVGHVALDHVIGVRIPASQPTLAHIRSLELAGRPFQAISGSRRFRHESLPPSHCNSHQFSNLHPPESEKITRSSNHVLGAMISATARRLK